MSENNSIKISKEDIELIALGLNEYINYVEPTQNKINKEEIAEIKNILNRLDVHLNDY